MAMIYDSILLSAVLFSTAMIYTVILVLIKGDIPLQGSLVETGTIITELEPVDLGWPIYPLLAFVYLFFFCYFWKKNGQTLGMQVWKIKLIDTNAEKVTLKQCCIRLMVAWISFFCLGIGYISLLKKDNYQTWHEKLSGTMTVFLG